MTTKINGTINPKIIHFAKAISSHPFPCLSLLSITAQKSTSAAQIKNHCALAGIISPSQIERRSCPSLTVGWIIIN